MEVAARLRRALLAFAALAVFMGSALGLGSTTAIAGPIEEKARELLAEARVLASEDEHSRAITCALAALELDASLESEAALLLGHQLTWSDRPGEAIPWYEKHLALHPEDREARLGLARALSWDGRTEESRSLYAELVRDDPNDPESLAGLARLSLWAGRDREAARRARELLALDPNHREARLLLAAAENRRGKNRAAEKLYEEVLADHPQDVEARIGRARARDWMGESDRARADLEGLETNEAVTLRDAIDETRGAVVDVGASFYDDADDQELDTVYGAIELAPTPSSTLRGEVRRSVSSEPGSGDVGLLRVTAGGTHRFNRAWELHAYAGMGRITSEQDVFSGDGETVAEDDVRRAIALVDAWLTWTPIDWTRFDFSYSRVPIETPKSLARGIVLDLASISARRRVHDQVVVEASSGVGEYSDDNERVSGSLAVEFTPATDGPVTLVAGGSKFTFDRSTDHGYYSPEDYNVIFGEARFARDLATRLRVEAFGRLSSERENDDDRFGVGAGGLDVDWKLASRMTLSAFARKTTSRFDTSAGYGREGWGVSLRIAP